MKDRAVLALADGRCFWGRAFGKRGETSGEIVFNTSMSGYQEILTDPSYAGQIVTLTTPHVGVCGVNPGDDETEKVFAQGLVVRQASWRPSSWRSQMPLDTWLKENEVVAVTDIDTRAVTRAIRDEGAQGACILSDHPDPDAAVARARAVPPMAGRALAEEVSTRKAYAWEEPPQPLEDWTEVPSMQGGLVAVLDFGVKRASLRFLRGLGAKVLVMPARSEAREILSLSPRGVFLSNGPGDPEPLDFAQETIRALADARVPMLGICLGHQLLALALGASTRKMKFGHHGANHPVLDLGTKKVYITSQNHGFCVEEKSLPEGLLASHRSLFDHTLQGVRHLRLPLLGVQGHPEACPGPRDGRGVFLEFSCLMEGFRA